jgi:hypothetical protein
MKDRGKAADLIASSGDGVTCQPGDSGGVVAAVKELAEAGVIRLTKIGRNGRTFYNRGLPVASCRRLPIRADADRQRIRPKASHFAFSLGESAVCK